MSGLLLSANKTLQGIYAQQVWPQDEGVSRRAMHAGVFEAGWDSKELMPRHRAVVSSAHRGEGLEGVGLDWTDVHHERGPEIDAAKRMYDHVEGRMSCYQRLITAAVANAEQADEIAAELRQQHPESFRPFKGVLRSGEEKAFWVFTKTVHLKRYGRKRLGLVHEHADLK